MNETSRGFFRVTEAREKDYRTKQLEGWCGSLVSEVEEGLAREFAGSGSSGREAALRRRRRRRRRALSTQGQRSASGSLARAFRRRKRGQQQQRKRRSACGEAGQELARERKKQKGREEL